MARWDPNAVGRLREAAMDLYRDPGYDKVTVAEIAAHAGLTPRTFFRYFPDKREVLFLGTERVEALVVERVMAAPEKTPALEAVAMGLAVVPQFSDEDKAHADYARKRHAVIQAYAELRERELGKHASLASAITAALRSRGVAEASARLAAEIGLAAFKVGFERWVDDPKRRKMGAHVREAMRGLGLIVLEQVAMRGKAPASKKSRKTKKPREKRDGDR